MVTYGKPKELVWYNSGNMPSEILNAADAGPLGNYYVSDGYISVWHNGSKISNAYNLENGKNIAQRHFNNLVSQLLTP